jgi:hypothetical protein
MQPTLDKPSGPGLLPSSPPHQANIVRSHINPRHISWKQAAQLHHSTLLDDENECLGVTVSSGCYIVAENFHALRTGTTECRCPNLVAAASAAMQVKLAPHLMIPSRFVSYGPYQCLLFLGRPTFSVVPACPLGTGFTPLQHYISKLFVSEKDRPPFWFSDNAAKREICLPLTKVLPTRYVAVRSRFGRGVAHREVKRG